MENGQKFNVYSAGSVVSGFQVSDVIQELIGLFKIDERRARHIIERAQPVKKNLDEKTAQAYKHKLESHGLAVKLTPVPSPGQPLSLEPIDPPPVSTSDSHAVADSTMWLCPKCSTEQVPSETCSGCGVYQHKVNAKGAPFSHSPLKNAPSNIDQARPKPDSSQVSSSLRASEFSRFIGDGLSPLAIATGCVVALLGALLWRFIALTFDYELGLIAWLIGGAIGFSVAFAGGRGDVSGRLCGVLALVAILGGKYLMVTGFQEKIQDALSQSVNELEYKEMFEAERDIAMRYFELPHTRNNQQRFMFEYGYTDAISLSGVSEEEVADFNEYTVPRFQNLVENPEAYGQWSHSLSDAFGDVSSIDLVVESIGLLDIVFLFLGIGTAFRLGRGELVS